MSWTNKIGVKSKNNSFVTKYSLLYSGDSDGGNSGDGVSGDNGEGGNGAYGSSGGDGVSDKEGDGGSDDNSEVLAAYSVPQARVVDLLQVFYCF